MSNQAGSDQTSPDAAPIQYEEVYAERPGWPKAVGVVSICWSVLGLGCAGCGVLSLTVFSGFMPPDMKDMPSMQLTPMKIGQLGTGVLHSVLLLVAGILTVSRQYVGRTLHLAYAGISLPMVGFGYWVSRQDSIAMKTWAADHPDNPAAKQMLSGGNNIGEIIGFAVLFGLGLAYPLFLLVWFGLVKRTRMSMTGVPDEVPTHA